MHYAILINMVLQPSSSSMICFVCSALLTYIVIMIANYISGVPNHPYRRLNTCHYPMLCRSRHRLPSAKCEPTLSESEILSANVMGLQGTQGRCKDKKLDIPI
jgi:hypothetical protein